jgi:hypothetical protein
MIISAELKASSSSTVVLINNDGMGSADEPLCGTSSCGFI